MKKNTTPNALDADADASLFPFTRSRQFELPPEYANARRECPVAPVTLWNGQRAWLLTKHADYRSVLLDERFSGKFAQPGFPAVTEARQRVDKLEQSFVGQDNPEHDRFRRMVTKEFTTRRMLDLRPAMERITVGLLNKMEAKGPPVDLVAEFSVELPALVMCELFGSPHEDHKFIARCAAGRHGLSQTPEQASRAANELVNYCRDLIAKKEAKPDDDMVSRVIEEHVKTGNLSREDFANMCAMILRAGHDTTANMISLGALLLLQHPEQLDLLKRDPEIVDKAVEELLRFLSPVQFAPKRVALEDVQVNGSRISEGDGVFAVSASANRDEDVFEDPDRLDITRDASSHLSFGYGIHRCLGQILARIELRVAFSMLFERFPDLALAQEFEEVPFKYDSQIYGLYELKVTW